MHIENLVKKTLGIKNHRIVDIDGSGDNLVVTLAAIKKRRLPCKECGHLSKQANRKKEREWLHVPLWGIPVFLRYQPHRVHCPVHGLRLEAIPWADGKQRMTKHLSLTMAIWAKTLAVEVVAGMFGVHWNTVYAAIKRTVQFGLDHREMGSILYIGIDEISRRKGHRYLTNVYDLQEKILLWSGKDRKEETLREFFEAHGDKLRETVKGVCCDMWAPYIKVVQEYIPDAVLVFDRFHLMKHLLDSVDAVRKEEVRIQKNTDPDVVTGTKYVLLKNAENLTNRQKERLGYLVKLNARITRAYILKEDFRQFFTYSSRYWAERFLDKWMWRATHSRLRPIRKFAQLLKRHREGILAWIGMPISNGATEAMNNNAKAISHRARGFSTFETYACMLLHCMGGLKMPEYAHSFV